MNEKKVLGGREKVKVAVVQAAPIFMDKERTLDKACHLIREAGQNDAELIVFSETYIPGYPAIYTGGWESNPSEWAPYMIALQDNSLLVGSRDTEILGEAAKEANAYVVIGCSELDDRLGSRTLYNTLVFISRDGRFMGRHRKLMPTYTERTYWGLGDSSDLKVFDTDIGRIGGLICGENIMVLVKAAMMHQGEEFHIAAWPGVWTGHGQTHLMDPETDLQGGSSALYPIIRSYACESQAFVLSSSGILRELDFPNDWKHIKDSDHTNYSWAVGGSAIVNPHGRLMSGPSIGDETILYADCHAYHIKLAKALFDCLGHYTRWDLIRLQIRKEPRSPEIEMGKKASIKLPIKELRQIAEKYGISVENLEELIEELNVFNSEQ
jgi:amidase/nitrilase